MAEGILRHHLRKKGIDSVIDSAGTSSWHEGESPDIRAIHECRKNGVDISHQRAKPFVDGDFDRFDMIFVMDMENYNTLLSKADGDAQTSKIRLLMDVLHPGRQMSVPDPYYGGKKGFESVYSMLDLATRKIIELYFNEK